MKIRCENCHADFFFEPPQTGELPLFTTCSQCQYPNPVPGGGRRLETQPMFTQCTSCGRQMTLNPEQAVAVCSACMAGDVKVSAAREWMVKRSDGQIYGPFDFETLQSWIQTAKIDARDEVARVGGQWKMFNIHPQFQKFFDNELQPPFSHSVSTESPPFVSAPSPIAPAISGSKKAAVKSRRSFRLPHLDLQALVVNFLALCATVALIRGTYEVVIRRTLEIPEPYVQMAKDLVDEYLDSDTSAVTVEADIAELQIQRVVEQLRKVHLEVREPSATYFAKGRSLYLRDTRESRRDAKKFLEMAMIANPNDDLALTALAQIYVESGDESLEQDAIRMIDRADKLNKGSAEVHRARAAFFVATAKYIDARTEAAECLKINPKDSEAEYYIALSYLRPKAPEYSEALGHLQKAIALDPGFHTVHRELGIVHLNLLEYRKAQESLQQAIQLDSGNVTALASLARLYEETGQFTKAFDLYEQSWRTSNAGDAQVGLRYGAFLYQVQANYGRALNVLSTIVAEPLITTMPLSETKIAYTHLAAVQRLGGDLEKAIQWADKALKIEPTFSPALFQKGLALMGQGKLDDAGKTLRSSSNNESGPDAQSQLRFYLGLISRSQKKTGEAVDELQGALDVQKTNLKALTFLVDTHILLGQDKEALLTAEKQSRQDPLYAAQRTPISLYFHNFPEMRSMALRLQQIAETLFYDAQATSTLGMVLLQMGQRPNAIQAFRRALDIDPNNITALLSLGVLAWDQEDYHSTIKYMIRLGDNAPQLGLPYVYLGMAQTELEKYREAEDALQKASLYDRTNATLQDALGVLHARQNKLREAKEGFRRAIELDPSFIPARRHLLQYIP